jgi:subtilisin family serine protease
MLKKIIITLIFLVFLTGNQANMFDLQIVSKTIPKTGAKLAGTKTSVTNVDINTSNKKLNDTYFNMQWSIGFTRSDMAWGLVNQKKQVKVAVVDSGVDYNHPDLKNRVLTKLGFNFISNNMDTMDDLGHGTEVAGIIAAQEGNNQGITGIVGPLDVKIIPVKVLDNMGRGPSDIVAKGIMYAVSVGADIINVSIDFNEHDEDIQNALKYAAMKKVLVVVASGNSNSNCDNYSPAGDPGAYTVAAITDNYEKAYFSSFGSGVSIAAPGIDILTTTPKGKYEEESGTSMSAPIVSGVAAMIKAANPNLTSVDIGNIINSTAKDVMKKGKDPSSGYGLIDAYRAVLAANAKSKAIANVNTKAKE